MCRPPRKRQAPSLRRSSTPGRQARQRVGSSDVLVHGVLCFVDADWPLLGGSVTTRDVHVLWPKKLYAKLQAQGPLAADTIDEIHRALAHALPPS